MKPAGKFKPMTPGMSSSARMRAYVTGAVLTVALSGVAYRAYGLQVDGADHYRALADRQHLMMLEVPAPRGEILDGRGRPLAVSADADSVWANPREIHDVTATAERLAKLLGEDEAVLEAKLGTGRKFVWLDRHVAPAVGRAVREAKLAGIEVAHEPRRWYPGRTIGGPVVGRADIDGKGVDGVELSMNALLVGKRGEVAALRDARGHTMLDNGLATGTPGGTVHLSLDRTIQAIADDALAEAVTSNKAKSGVVAVVEVGTGRVLALSSVPTLDPNVADAKVTARDKPVTDAYEIGSLMKVFTVATALDAGAVRADEEFQLGGSLKLPGRSSPIRDVHVDAYLTVAGIIKRSSNVGAAKIALRLGRDKLYAGLKRFGFGAKSGIELPGEQSGNVRDGSRWRDVELATIAFGYGITVTPLQVAAGLAALGNHGLYVEPRIVDQVTDADGTVLYAAKPGQRQVVSPKVAKEMMAMLASVFDRDLANHGKNAGTAHTLTVPGFVCGGKTGTAHKYDPATHKYAPDRYLGSFVGLAPIANPRLAIIALIDDPSGGDYYGGTTAGPVFAKVASESLRYLGVPGDAPLPPPVAVAAKPTAKPAPAAHPAQPDHPAAETMPIDAPVDGTDVDAGMVLVPDLRGLGVGRAIDLARKAKLAIDVVGSGRVVEQDPMPGLVAAPVRVKLVFSDDNLPSKPTPAAAP
jgi:cell division protein FtsI (penicillin-binding protein 3)